LHDRLVGRLLANCVQALCHVTSYSRARLHAGRPRHAARGAHGHGASTRMPTVASSARSLVIGATRARSTASSRPTATCSACAASRAPATMRRPSSSSTDSWAARTSGSGTCRSRVWVRATVCQNVRQASSSPSTATTCGWGTRAATRTRTRTSSSPTSRQSSGTFRSSNAPP